MIPGLWNGSLMNGKICEDVYFKVTSLQETTYIQVVYDKAFKCDLWGTDWHGLQNSSLFEEFSNYLLN